MDGIVWLSCNRPCRSLVTLFILFKIAPFFVDSISQDLTTVDVLAMNDHDALARRALRVAAAVRTAILDADITVAYDIPTMWEGFGG